MPTINHDFNRIQINESTDKDSNGNVLRRSLMINVRADSVKEADELYRDLKQVFNGNSVTINDNEKNNGKDPICPNCGSPMIFRRGRNGNFYGCSRYPACRTTRQPDEVEVIEDEEPF